MTDFGKDKDYTFNGVNYTYDAKLARIGAKLKVQGGVVQALEAGVSIYEIQEWLDEEIERLREDM